MFATLLNDCGIKEGSILDIGCGKGRNASFLQRLGYNVFGMDFVEDNLKELPFPTVCHDITMPWPFTSQFDGAVDIFCFKHLTEKKYIEHYIEELNRVTKTNAYYLLSLASKKDGFYGQFLKANSNVIIDPYIHIPSTLYSKEEIENLFATNWRLCAFMKTNRKSLMHSKEYLRSVFTFIFQKVN